MKSETTMLESELPQLQEAVLENTRRINQNETAIKLMNMRLSEESWKCQEQGERMKSIRRKHDQDMFEIRETLGQVTRIMRESEEYRKESNRQFDEMRKESDRRFDEMRKESDKRIEESRRATDEQIRRISVEFLGVNGHIVEGLASSAVDKIFQEAGLELLHYGKNIRPKHPEANKHMEIDVLLGNSQYTVPVEVKADFTKKKVRRFVHRMKQFRKLFPEYADKEVIAAVAAINYSDGADQLAHEEGLLVIRVSSDDIFTLDPFKEEDLRRF